MAAALQALGIAVETDENSSSFVVDGTGGRIPAAEADLYVGNAGTAARFLTGIVALGHGTYRLDGTPRMRQRPIQPLLDGLNQLGVSAHCEQADGCLPIVVEATGLAGGRTKMPGNQSSQFFSSLLLVGPCTARGIDIEVEGHLVSRPYIDLTVASMHAFGAAVINQDYRRLIVPAGQSYQPRDYDVEPDASAASYFLAAAALCRGRIRVEHLGCRSAQGDVRFVDVLSAMGCQVIRDERYLEVTGPAQLQGVDVDMADISDTALTLAAIAPFAISPVKIRGIGHTRLQETDRIRAATAELRRLGARVEEHTDGLVIYPSAERLHGANVQTYDDHRVAMSFALVGLRIPGVRITDPQCVTKTFPDFFERFRLLQG